MAEHNPHRRSGWIMLGMAWLLMLGGGWWVASHWLGTQDNPNQRVTVQGDGAVVLVRNRAGHYVANGEINGRPVTFMVDTGASDVALSTALARDLGLKRGAAVSFVTANGVAAGFETRLDTVQLGTITVRDVRASFADGMLPDQVLLGMSFLKQVEFTQRGERLILRPLR